MVDRIRAERVRRGWSQQELAERAGVTRQLISSVEAGRHAPNVHAALAIADALDRDVAWLFTSSASPVAPVIGDALPAIGAAVIAARVGEQLVVAPIDHGVEPSERWAVAEGTLGPDGIEMFPDALTDGLVIAGCDPALGVLANLVARVSPHRVVAVHASTGRSVTALAGGRVHGVVVHGPLDQLPEPPVAVRRIELARWNVGLASARSHGVPSLDELAARRTRVVQRDPGAGSQRALAKALERIGAPGRLPGPVAEGHVDVARRVAAGAAAGITMEAAARSFGLGFAPLERHVVELWIDHRWHAHPAAAVLVDVLVGESFRRRLGLLGGYDLSSCGVERTAGREGDRP
jgi:transcriptional regulator with XRE-family HTH domain/molybdate-binding protein